ncbi:helix-turn-helix domain-containing protein [Microbacterium sp. CFBP 8794]|nr:helix-turn-helix domain-containing protein [Microbacterium sp. CFBP 8794]MBD8479385.1 helix-turn-helix domain-containing protein [Microbacterium sp. CFBP 8794]
MLAALAVPSRLAILSLLLSVGPRTATECAEVVGATASNCSWHLRELARLGLVERSDDDTGDARKRPWRATITGIDLDAGGGPADDLTRAAVRSAWFADTDARFDDYLRHESDLAEPWREAAVISDYAVLLTADELADLGARIDAIVRPYVRATRADVPAGSAVASISVRGVVDPRFVDPRFVDPGSVGAGSSGRRARNADAMGPRARGNDPADPQTGPPRTPDLPSPDSAT